MAHSKDVAKVVIENKVTIAGLDEYVQVMEWRVLFLKFLSLNATDTDGGFTKYDVAEPSTCSEMVNKVLQAASLTDTFQKAVTDGTANDEVKRAAAKSSFDCATAIADRPDRLSICLRAANWPKNPEA